MTHLVILTKVTTRKFYMSIDNNLSNKGWHVDYIYRFIDKLCTCGVDTGFIETRAARKDLEDCAENLMLKVSDMSTRKGQCFKKDTVLLQDNVADLLEETAECDVLILSHCTETLLDFVSI